MALDFPEVSCRGLACKMTDEREYYISESSVYRILKSQGLITSPAFDTVSASNEFKDKTTRVNQMWQTDFTYLKIIGWGWYYLSTILDDYSRYIVHWELCTNMGGRCQENRGKRPGKGRSATRTKTKALVRQWLVLRQQRP